MAHCPTDTGNCGHYDHSALWDLLAWCIVALRAQCIVGPMDTVHRGSSAETLRLEGGQAYVYLLQLDFSFPLSLICFVFVTVVIN